MPHSARTVSPGTPHHLTLRGNNKRTLFSQAPDYERFINYLGDALIAARVEVHAAVLMTNHVHLVATPPELESLAKFVQPMAQRYAQYRNKKRDSSGKLFEGPFWSEPIEEEAHLAATLAYVELNPLRAGMKGGLDHPWSTYGCHVGKPSKFPTAFWTPSAWYLALGATSEERVRRYREWVADCAMQQHGPRQAVLADARDERVRRTATAGARRPDRSRAT